MCYRLKHKLTEKKFVETDQRGVRSVVKSRKKVDECLCTLVSVNLDGAFLFDESLSTVIVLDFSSNNSVGVVIQG